LLSFIERKGKTPTEGYRSRAKAAAVINDPELIAETRAEILWNFSLLADNTA
jgi:hypothetical protein